MRKLPMTSLFLSLFVLAIAGRSFAQGDCGQTSISEIYYSLDSCEAYVLAGTTMDYSEFEAIVISDGNCAQITAIGTVYRENPTVNKHSCTPGVDGDLAMCISSLDFCEFIPDHQQALRFEFLVEPQEDKRNYLNALSFYEQAPDHFNWVDGPSGENNYPIYYGMRILKNGVEVYSIEDVPTSRNWSMQEYDLSSIEELNIEEPTVFSFELLPYCLVGNTSTVSAWDIDEVRLDVACTVEEPNAGYINLLDGSIELEICVTDDEDDLYDVSLFGNYGSQSLWIITSKDSVILDFPSGPSFDFGIYNKSEYLLWHMSYEGNPAGLEISYNLSDVYGCYSLSNNIVIRQASVIANEIELNSGGYEYVQCLNTGLDFEVSVRFKTVNSFSNKWVLTDENGSIISVQEDEDIEFSDSQPGLCFVYNVSYFKNFEEIYIGNNVFGLSGCYAVSNSIAITKEMVSGGMLSLDGETHVEFCVYDGLDIVFDVDLINASGSGSVFVLSNLNDEIIDVFLSSTINLGSLQVQECKIYHVSYESSLLGLDIGKDVNDLIGCFDISNALYVSKTLTDTPYISYEGTTHVVLCNDIDKWTSFSIDIEGHSGDSLIWLICNLNGNVLELRDSPTLDLSAYVSSSCHIYALSYQNIDHGISIGSNISSISGTCMALSNLLVVEKHFIEAGRLHYNGSTEIELCYSTSVETINLSNEDVVDGQYSVYVVTDESGHILSLHDSSEIQLIYTGTAPCNIYYLSYSNDLDGLDLGKDLSALSGCYDLSNAVKVYKQLVTGGNIVSSYGSSELYICLNSGDDLQFDAVLTGAIGSNSIWIVSDVNSRILEISQDPSFDLSKHAGTSFKIWHLSYNSNISGLQLNMDLASISGSCFAFSNSINVHVLNVKGGFISSDQGDVIELCEGGDDSPVVNVHLQDNSGPNSLWLLTNTSGDILRIMGSPPFNLGGISSGICEIRHLSFGGNILGLLPGLNLSALQGCYGLSNAITIYKNNYEGGHVNSNYGKEVELCIIEGQEIVMDITVDASSGGLDQLVVTDLNGFVLSIPNSNSVVIDGSFVETCLIWNLSYETELYGLAPGVSIYELSACYGISDSITVEKNFIDGGIIVSDQGSDIVLCENTLDLDSVIIDLYNNRGLYSSWILYSDSGEILATRGDPYFDYNSITTSSLNLVHISYNDDLDGLLIGSDISSLSGCYDLSNIIRINRLSVHGGILESNYGTNIIACTNDGVSDLVEFSISQSAGANSQLFIADSNGIILDKLNGNILDLEGLSPGICFVYHMAYFDSVSGFEIGNNFLLVEGCYSLSNSIEITKIQADGGVISSVFGDSIYICVDGEADIVDFTLESYSGSSSVWLITDLNGDIVKLEYSNSFDLDLGINEDLHVCHLSYSGPIFNLIPGNNLSDLVGCFDLSNTIIVHSISVDAGELIADRGIEFELCVDPDSSSLVRFEVSNSTGINQLVLTSANGDIIELIDGLEYEFKDHSTGICYVYNVAYSNSITGLEVGSNIDFLEACYDISNSIKIVKIDAYAGTISSVYGDSIFICVDDYPDLVEFELDTSRGAYDYWIVTDENDVILEILNSSIIDLDRGVEQEIHIYHLSSADTSIGLIAGSDLGSLTGCYDISNKIVVNAYDVRSAQLSCIFGDSFEICVGDGYSDLVEFVHLNSSSQFNYLITTDIDGVIQSINSDYILDLDTGLTGICRVWNLSYSGLITGLTLGANIQDLEGCYEFSNYIEVIKTIKNAGMISVEGKDEITVCVGDSINEYVYIDRTGGVGSGLEAWLICNELDEILDIQYSLPIELKSSSDPVCKIYFICYTDNTSGVQEGASLENIEGCNSISNAITVFKSFYHGMNSFSSMLSFSMNYCYSDSDDGSNMDYSEFWANIMNDDQCVEFELLDDNLYRENNEVNTHSCTEGFDGLAMCVGALNSCSFEEDSDLAIRFAVQLSPDEDGRSALSSLSFYEQSPDQYSWVNGPTGLNNYPQRYGLRILKNGNEIYRETDIATNPSWKLQEFDFTDLVDFHFTETSVFEFELLGYCLVGNNSDVSAWDIDELKLSSVCLTGLVQGDIRTTSGTTDAVICMDQNSTETLELVILEGSGENLAWLITDHDNSILDIQTTEDVDFSAISIDSSLLWLISYSNGIEGLDVGNELDELIGCFEISNSISVIKLDDEDCEDSENNAEEEDPEELEIAVRKIVQDFNIVPNPAVDKIVLSLEHMPAYGTQFSIYDKVGRMMDQMKLNDKTLEIDLNPMSQGFYYLRIESGESIVTKKFIKL